MPFVNSSGKAESNVFKSAFSNVSLNLEGVSDSFETAKANEVEEVDLSSVAITEQISVEEYYQKVGFTDTDIQRIKNGEITPDALLVEIEKDSNQDRYKKLMQSSMLQNYKNSLVGKKDSKEMIKLIDKNVKEFQKEKKKLERNNDEMLLTSFIAKVKDGTSYNDAMKETAVWVDSDGNKYYQKPVATREQASKTYSEISFAEVLGKNNKNLAEFKNTLENGKWTNSKEQEKAFKNVIKTADDLKKSKKETIKKIDKALKDFKQQKKQLKEGATDVKFDFNSMDELNLAVIDTKDQLKMYREEKAKLESNTEVNDLSSMISFMNLLKKGKNYEDALDQTAAWINENGKITYVNPYSTREGSNSNYKAVTYRELYKDNQELKQIKALLENGKWVDNLETENLFKQIIDKKNTLQKSNEKNLKDINKKIQDLEEAYSLYTSAQKNINTEVNYYLKNIHSYINKDDFTSKNKFNDDSKIAVQKQIAKYNSDTNNYKSSIKVNDEDEVLDLISCMINNQGVDSDGNILNTKTATKVYISSDDMLYENMQSWLPFMSDTEKEVFNYIYNTKGKKAARKYLNNISDMLDKRWTADKESKDREFAEEHPVLATTLSVVKSPFEGMNAAYQSTRSVYNGEKIRRTNVYSSSDVYRDQVSTDIAENYGEQWAFLYNTGTSMADTGMLILASSVTGVGGLAGISGKAARLGLSAGLMGSKSYTSTLNDALDRGLSDGAAVSLAFSSAVTESAMESYSLGHLMNLESTLSAGASSIATKFGSHFSNEALQNIATKSGYIMFGAISQGLCEGEEEFATEIVNGLCDNWISGDLSNHTITINNYMNLGYTEDEARQIANVEYTHQLGQAFLGGFTSGVLFGAGGSLNYNAKASKVISNSILNDYVQSGKTKSIDLYNSFINGKYENAIDLIANDSTKTSEQKLLLSNHLAQTLSMNLNLSQEQAQSLYEKINNTIVTQNNTSINQSMEAGISANATNTFDENINDNVFNSFESVKDGINKNIESDIKVNAENTFETANQEVDNNPNSVVDGIEYVVTQFMNKYDCTREQALSQIESAIRTENFSNILTEGNARELLMGYSLVDLRNGYNQIINNTNKINSVINDIEYTITQLMNQYDCTREQALSQIESAIRTENFSNIIIEGNARKQLMGYSLVDLRNGYNQIIKNTNRINSAINDIEYTITQFMNKYDCTREQALSQIADFINTRDFSYITTEGNARKLLMKYSLEEIMDGYNGVLENIKIDAVVDEFIDVLQEVNKTRDESLLDSMLQKIENNFNRGEKNLIKRKLIDNITETDFINELKASSVFLLSQDTEILKSLFKTDKYKDFLITNLKKCTNIIAPTLQSLDLNTLNELFNDPQILNYIQSLDISDFVNMINSSKDNTNWLSADPVINKVVNLSPKELTELSRGLSKPDYFVKEYNISNKGMYGKIYEKIEKLLTIDNIKSDPSLVYLCNLFPSKQSFKVVNDIFSETIENYLKTDNIDYSNVKNILETNNNLYYNLTFEIDGKTIPLSFKNNLNEKSILTLFGSDGIDGIYRLLNSGIIIKSFDVDINRNNNVLYTGDKGKYVLTIDTPLGNKQVILDSDSNGCVDANSFSNKYNKSNIISIDKYTSKDIKVDNDGYYKITFTDGDKVKTYIEKSASGTLSIDSLSSKYSLINMDVSDIQMINIDDVLLDNYNLNQYKGTNDIYNEAKYGGNQSDIPALLTGYLTGQSQTIIDYQKAEILESIIKKYFPDATDNEIRKIGEKYASHGCGYMAISNAFVTYISNNPNAEKFFKKNFGYDLISYDGGTKSYNNEAVALDIFLDWSVNQCANTTYEELIKKANGISRFDYTKVVEEYFKTKNVVVNNNGGDLISMIYNNPNNFNIISSNEFDLEQLENSMEQQNYDMALGQAKTTGNITKEIGGHAMLITEIGEGNDIIVSSWSGKYRYLKDSIKNYAGGSNYINSISFELIEEG